MTTGCIATTCDCHNSTDWLCTTCRTAARPALWEEIRKELAYTISFIDVLKARERSAR